MLDSEDIKTIKYFLRENDQYLGMLEAEGGHIKVTWAKEVPNEHKEVLNEYFSANISDWELKTFQRSAGGLLKDSDGNPTGGHWDGVETISIKTHPDDFLSYLFLQVLRKDKIEKFGMKYIITLNKGYGLPIR